MSAVCPSCSCTAIEHNDKSGEAVCIGCGTVVEENTIVSSVEFQESGGSASVIGQYVSATSATAAGITGRMKYGNESRETTLRNGRQRIIQVAGMLRLGQHFIDSAHRLFSLSVQRSFTIGRKAIVVVAACLYAVCRREKSPHLLIDFSDKLQTNVFVLGKVYVKLCRLLNLQIPVLDPSLYIHRFASQLPLKGKEHEVSLTALRLVASMKRDWMETGRRPSGICGAALLISMRAHQLDCSREEIIDVVHICNETLRRRLREFAQTPTAQLTFEQFGRVRLTACEADPPSFHEARLLETFDQLREETNRLEISVEKSTIDGLLAEKDISKSLHTSRYSSVESNMMISGETGIQTQLPTGSSIACSREHPHSQHVSHKMRSRSRSGSVSSLHNRESSLISVNESEEKFEAESASSNLKRVSVEKEEDEDYGFQDEESILVSKATQESAKEAVRRFRKRACAMSRRQQKEKEIYSSIEKELLESIESDLNSCTDDISDDDDDQDPEEPQNETLKENLNKIVTTEEGSDTGKQEVYPDAEEKEMKEKKEDESVEDLEEEEEEEEETDDSGYNSEKRTKRDEHQGSSEATEQVEGELDKMMNKPEMEIEDGGNLSELDDVELDAMILNDKEVCQRTKLWMRMNADYLKEQEEKAALIAINGKPPPRKRRKKKASHENAPAANTAEHAIYSLKSKKMSKNINYDVLQALLKQEN